MQESTVPCFRTSRGLGLFCEGSLYQLELCSSSQEVKIPKNGTHFPISPSFFLPVFPSVGRSESLSGQRRFHTLRFPARCPEPAQTQTLLPGASPAPRWWSGRPSSHQTSSIWQPAPERPHTHTHTHTHGAEVKVRGMMRSTGLLMVEVDVREKQPALLFSAAIFSCAQSDFCTDNCTSTHHAGEQTHPW